MIQTHKCFSCDMPECPVFFSVPIGPGTPPMERPIPGGWAWIDLNREGYAPNYTHVALICESCIGELLRNGGKNAVGADCTWPRCNREAPGSMPGPFWVCGGCGHENAEKLTRCCLCSEERGTR